MIGAITNPAQQPFLATGNGNGNKMNLKVEILENLLKASGDGNSAKINSLRQAIQRSKTDMAESLADSLDLLRQVFQSEMTEEIKQVIDRHLRTTFAPAFENLKRNGHSDISRDCINELCLNILNGAKEPFVAKPDPSVKTCIPSGSLLKRRKDNVDDDRKYESDENESDTSMASFSTNRTNTGRDLGNLSDSQRPKKRGRPRKVNVDTGRCGTPILKGTTPVSFLEVCKWNPDRITPEVKFVLGSKVSKLLNMGHRGHIFVKYPRVFRYVCDDEDKTWLFDRNISTRMSGKVFFVVLEDALEIATLENAPLNIQSEFYRYAFHVPERVMLKMKKLMFKPFESLKTRVAQTASPMQMSPLSMNSINRPFPTTPNLNLNLSSMINMIQPQSVNPAGANISRLIEDDKSFPFN
ncbi:unnamed protein product [Bursaphelenchus xylophilus]|uniref:(pine wood nematode) hypothetical protein n=1 Tax=Bursaphelenchus xylophilus TaxID=6326 RepID=A0A1I7STR0_BURXY|nr:unnamed protein product [Bursaphelenchus xylophilus]CAG9108081.1 unnamed protein product [Bursaphelenchus xylophilus]